MRKLFNRLFVRGRHHVHNKNGWAIMSSLIAIFIGLIMIAGIFGLVQMAMQGSKVQRAQNNIGTIRSGIQQLFAGQPDYSGLSTDLARQAGIFPSEMVTSGNNVRNAWNGDANVREGSNPTLFEIEYNDVPEEPCVDLASFGYGTWRSVSVGGSSISQSGGTAVSDAVNACSGDSNTVIFEGE